MRRTSILREVRRDGYTHYRGGRHYRHRRRPDGEPHGFWLYAHNRRWGLGCPRDQDEAKRVLRRAVEVGINFIDTADSYGPDVSEELIAEALHPYPAELVIATKGGLTRPGPGRWVPDGRPEYLRTACEGSLRRLRLDRIPLYQLHRPDPKVPYWESIGALVELKEEGKIRHIGVSNVTEPDLRRAMDLTAVVSVQNRYNAADRSSESMVDLCEQEDLVFLPWAPIQEGESNPAIADAAARMSGTPSDRPGLAAGPLAAGPAHTRDEHRSPPRGQRGGSVHPTEPGGSGGDKRRWSLKASRPWPPGAQPFSGSALRSRTNSQPRA